ncbi:MAG: hypothetical protein AB1592_14355 [Pseudomonadota bacterium]
MAMGLKLKLPALKLPAVKLPGLKLPASRKGRLLMAGGALGAVLILGGAGTAAFVLLAPEAAHEEAAAPAGPPPPPPLDYPEKGAPKAQRALMAAIEAGRAAMAMEGGMSAPRLIQARAARGDALCAALSEGPPRRWVGTISQVGVNEDKLGTLTVELAPGISVKTWNTAAADAGYGTLLDPKGLFFVAADVFGRGQQVVFSGSFFPSPLDCISLANLNPASALREPAFLMKFEDMRPLGPLKNPPPADAKGKGKDKDKGGDHTGSVAKH